jgi:hypothetical protein
MQKTVLSNFRKNSSGKYEIRGLILVFLVSSKSKTNIQFNGREYASADEMPLDVRAAYDRAVGVLHSGARLAAKLKAKIIVNGTEFNHAGELSVDDRQLYHGALEVRKIGHKKRLLVVVVVSVFAGAVYLWLRGFFG